MFSPHLKVSLKHWLSMSFWMSSTVFWINLLNVCIICWLGVDGEQCRRKDPNGNDDFFSCPRLFESSKKKYCCGTSLQDKHCCEWSKKIRDGPTPEAVKQFFESAVAIIILVLLIIGGLIVCCCVVCCCLLSRKRQQRGRVLGMSDHRMSDHYLVAFLS